MIYIAVQLIQIFSAYGSTGHRSRVTVVQEVLADLKIHSQLLGTGMGDRYSRGWSGTGILAHPCVGDHVEFHVVGGSTWISIWQFEAFGIRLETVSQSFFLGQTKCRINALHVC